MVEPEAATDPARGWRAYSTPWIVLAVSLSLTLIATSMVALRGSERDDARFDNAVQSAHDRIAGRLDIYLTTLNSGAALFAASDSVEPEEFRRFVERLEVHEHHPGVQGIGWTRRIEYMPGADPDERHSIEYLEPLDERNLAALGYDMYSEETRRAAMARARDRGEPALSGRVILVQEIVGPQQPGFLLYVPVYATGRVPPTVEQRREQLLGFVYAPFRAGDLFHRVFGSEALPRVSFTVYDGERADTTALLHASERAADHRPRMRQTEHLEIAGRIWTVVFESQPEFEAGSVRGSVPTVLLVCLLATAWLFWLARGQANARAAAETASRAKSAFLANMSHELRTPLNAIGGYVDLMDLGIAGPVTDAQKQYFERIQRAQQHLLSLINDVLEFAKLGTGRTQYQLVDVPVRDLVEEAASLIEPQAELQGLHFEKDGGPPAVVRGDPEKLRQILLNLLSNAVKFTEPGGQVSIDWSTDAGVVAIAVRDTGVGIPRERLATIFEPFVQVDADLTRTRQGTGLGLSISHALAEAMHGEIEVDSEVGRGSTFVLKLPCERPAS